MRCRVSLVDATMVATLNLVLCACAESSTCKISGTRYGYCSDTVYDAGASPPRPDASPTPNRDAGGDPDATFIGTDAGEPTTRLIIQLERPCDPASTTELCVSGSTCLMLRGEQATCVRDGSAYGRCREAGTDCDIGLGCTNADTPSRCVPLLELGQFCDVGRRQNLCASPGICGSDTVSPVCERASREPPPPSYEVSSAASNDSFTACRRGTSVTDYAGLTMNQAAIDDGYARDGLMLPFRFTFFGAEQTRIWPHINGYAVLGDSPPVGVDFSEAHPRAQEDGGLFPFGENLFLGGLSTFQPAGICYETMGSGPNRTFIVQWWGAEAWATPDQSLVFSIVLHETSNIIDFSYESLPMDFGNLRPWVGIQTAQAAEEIPFQGMVSARTNLSFTPVR